jgi:hypothetical protein
MSPDTLPDATPNQALEDINAITNQATPLLKTSQEIPKSSQILKPRSPKRTSGASVSSQMDSKNSSKRGESSKPVNPVKKQLKTEPSHQDPASAKKPPRSGTAIAQKFVAVKPIDIVGGSPVRTYSVPNIKKNETEVAWMGSDFKSARDTKTEKGENYPQPPVPMEESPQPIRQEK